MAYKDSAQYDQWAEGYDAYVAKKDEQGKFPFAGYSTAIDTILKTIGMFDGTTDVLDLGCGTGLMDAKLVASGHNVYGVDFSPKMLELAKKNAPGALFYQADLSKGFLPEELKGRRFKVILMSFFFHRLPSSMRLAFLQYLNYEVLEDGGMVLIADTCFEDGEQAAACKNSVGEDWDVQEDYPIYSEYKDQMKKLVFQKVSFCTGIMAFTRFSQEEAKKPIEAEEPKAEEKSGYKKEDFVRYSPEEIASWKRVRDIPGETVEVFGLNFMQAIQPYQIEANKSWKNYRNTIANTFKGTFNTNDLLFYRTSSISAYVHSSLALPNNERSIELTSQIYAAAFLHNRFPSQKIGMNLFALYYGLTLDLKIVFRQLLEDYGESAQQIAEDLKNVKGTKVANALMGIAKNHY